MAADKFRQRLDALFADIKRVADISADDAPAVRREIDALRARLLELETQFVRNEKYASAQAIDSEARPTHPILYEQEEVGYAFNGDQMEVLNASIPASPNGGHIFAALLAAGGRTIGEIQIQPSNQRSWSQEDINLANAVARQVSLQIENLRLLATTERARAEAETASRRFIHEGWESYLDAINRNERIGYAYDQSSVTSFDAKFQASVGFEEAVNVMDEQVGTLYLRTDPNRPLTDDDKTLIITVADRVAQQFENIRLLADASRARAEAEEATRRLAHDNWKTYVDQQKDESALGFIYDSNQVVSLGESFLPQDVVLTQPLKVRGETIGQLAVAGGQRLSAEDVELAAAIAAQTSIHLETLRLNEELQKRASELQELDRLKSSFLANMSHELRTPLNSILGFSDVMLEELDGPLTENMNNDLHLIQKNGQHLLHLINDVLDMAKIESGRMNFSPEKFKAHEILDEVTSITSTLASEKNVALFIESDTDKDVEIIADRTRLRQVMINLVNNSIKFTEKGKIAIRVTRQEGDKILITVRDTGMGIPSDKLEIIFQEFAQIDTSMTRKVGGTGLGLPISRRLVEMHGGRLWAESTGVIGEGSTFYVELPLEAQFAEPIEKLTK